jgi:exonuclease III
MRLVTYNMRQGGRLGPGNAWVRAVSALRADVIFAQETWDPRKYHDLEAFKCVHANVAHGRWGSALAARVAHWQEISVPGFQGWAVAAECEGLAGGPDPTLLLSVHIPSPGPYEPHMQRLIDVMKPLAQGKQVVLAGDLNVTTAVRHLSETRRNTRGEGEILARLWRELGVKNAWQHRNPDAHLPQTLRWVRDPEVPYHCDGIFLSETLLERVQSAEVLGGAEWKELSDHYPVVVDLSEAMK